MEVLDNSSYDRLTSSNVEKCADMSSADAAAIANRKIWQWILAAGGAGLLTRGMLGLGRMKYDTKNEYEASPSAQTISIGLPRKDEEHQKLGADKSPSSIAALLSNLTPFINGTTPFTGKGVSSPWAVPALYAFGIPAAAGAFGLGYKGTDMLLDSRRKNELEDEQSELERRYEQLLSETMAKRGGDVHTELDELADLCMEKQAIPLLGDPGGAVQKGTNILYGGSGLVAAYALLAALASGKISYDYFKKRSLRDTTQEALQRRQKERFGGTAPIYLSPREDDGAGAVPSLGKGMAE